MQVLMLAMAGFVMLSTRFANIGLAGPRGGGGLSALFPDVGQILAVLVWAVSLMIVSLPILVKLLPRLNAADRADQRPFSLVEYLREYLSDEAWASDRTTSREEIDAVASRFAENSFWPTGNNRARYIYFLSFWAFFVVLVPDVRVLSGGLPAWATVAGWGAAGVFALVATWLLFRILASVLAYVDDRLVDPQAAPGSSSDTLALQRRRKIPIGVFISYRRADSAPFAGRLRDSLAKSIDEDRIFMDLDSIEGGADFEKVITAAIGSARAIVVVIGPSWLTAAGPDGKPRIMNPEDLVHAEIRLGLERGLRIFPVLVGGASMPSTEALPDRLKPLSKFNAIEVSNSRWDYDVGLLVQQLRDVPRWGT